MISPLEEFQSHDFSFDYRLRSLFSMIPRGGTLLDIGSGTGYIADYLGRSFSQITLSDNSGTLVDLLKRKYNSQPHIIVRKLDAENLPTDGRFDVITLCDILEHLSNDQKSLKGCLGLLKEGGKIFISVPAFGWLYGVRDKTYGHVRRYSMRELKNLIEDSGLLIDQIYYWNFLGLIPYIVSEKLFRRPLVGPARIRPEGLVAKLVNKLIYQWLNLETKIHPPFGLSLIAVAMIKTPK